MLPEGPAGVLAALLALVAGYAAGSVPLTAWIVQAARVDPEGEGEPEAGPTGVSRVAGPGWGLLALTGDLAKGVLPVAIATVTWSWGAGWAAGLGAVLGACWPALGRLAGGRGLAVFAAAAFTLAPPAGILGALLALAVAGGARLLGRDGRVPAFVVGIGTYPLLFIAAQADPVRLAALLALYLVLAVRAVTAGRR